MEYTGDNGVRIPVTVSGIYHCIEMIEMIGEVRGGT